MVRELAENNFLKDFGQEGEVWHWSVVFQDLGVKSCFLRRGLKIADLKADGKRPECRESLMIDVRSGRRSWRQWVRKDAGRGSSSHVFLFIYLFFFYCGLIQYFLHFIFRNRLQGTPNRASERLIGYRGRGDRSWVKTATNGSYLTVKEVRKALWKFRERNGRG